MTSTPPHRPNPLPAAPSKVIAYIDGGARGNPGPAAFGVRFEHPDGEIIAELKEAIGTATNNVAEYRALIAALRHAIANGYREVDIRSDSQLLVRQMLGEYKVKEPALKALHGEARLQASSIPRVSYRYVPRSENLQADRLVNEALDEKERGEGISLPAQSPAKEAPRARKPAQRSLPLD